MTNEKKSPLVPVWMLVASLAAGSAGGYAMYRAAPDPIVSVLVAPADTIVTTDSTAVVQMCAFFVLKSGRVGMDSDDAIRCGSRYRSSFTMTQRALTKKEQQSVDAGTTTWTVTQDSVP